jgi:hypothetical protein
MKTAEYSKVQSVFMKTAEYSKVQSVFMKKSVAKLGYSSTTCARKKFAFRNMSKITREGRTFTFSIPLCAFGGVANIFEFLQWVLFGRGKSVNTEGPLCVCLHIVATLKTLFNICGLISF